jgi:copper oxidase (laccase) domain-containing protein
MPFFENLNRGRFETWTTRPDLEMIQATQVHGTDIVSPETLPCEADGIFVSWEKWDRPIAIKTADCMPIIIEGEQGVVFLHAGWRGLANGILERAELHMISPQRVFIGPSIQECCFEVSHDFIEHFPGSSNFIKRNGKSYFNLPAEARSNLSRKFPSLFIQQASVCTCCNPAFHSYRRNKTTERNWNLYRKG